MKNLFYLLMAVFIVFSPVFSTAQESTGGADEELSTENVSEPPSHTAQRETIKEEEQGVVHLIQEIVIALAIIFVIAFLVWLLWRIFRRLNIKIERSAEEKVKPLKFRNLELLSTKHIVKVIQLLFQIFKYIITFILLFLTVPILFSIFPATKYISETIFDYILTPLKNIGLGIIKYIPNLITIIIIIAITRYLLLGLKFFAKQIEKGKLVLPGFYADWAQPTLKILQVLLWAFTLAIVYPYLPGSDSRAFQGVSVFIGVLISLGSSTAIGNLVAGLVITYMRPFKIGDRVQIKEITGFVVEKNLMVVRLKTHKNEYVTFPNIMILGSNIINYNTSSDEDEEGLILYAEITCQYSTPWQTIHDILINAALATEYIQKKPMPFVLQTQLDDFYARYQINCYTKEVSKIPSIYADLFGKIQDGFREAGLDLTSAHYRVITEKNKS